MATTTNSTTPTTFYVDYATGSDTNSGTSPNSPWKHAPGDPNATGNVAKASLIGGDEVLFAGGVVYQGSINLNKFSGTPGNPIVYSGTGWGPGQAIMSGLTSAQLTFTPLPGNPSLSVATLPAGLIPAGMSTETESAMSNVVEIDGNVTQLSNNSTSTNPNFPDNGQIAYSASDMTGSGASWTFTDPALSQLLSNASPSTITNMVFRAFASGDAETDLTVTGYNPTTNTLSLSGSFTPPSSGAAFTLYNDSALVGSSNPYSEYALEGNQIIAAVTPGVHTVSVSTAGYAFDETNQSNVTINGFSLSGYGAGNGRAIYLNGGQNIQITNNTLSNIATHDGYGLAPIYADVVTNLTISGNSVGPNIANGAGIDVFAGTNDVVANNTINSPGYTGIVAFDDVNTSISDNQLSNIDGVHANAIIAYDTNSTSGPNTSQNVSITNNQINNSGSAISAGAIAIEGNGAVGLSATPDNFTVAYNVITNQLNYGIADWGDTNTANIYGNIVLNIPSANYASLDLASTSKNISIYDNILEDYPWINPKSPQPGDTFSSNVALTTNFLQNTPVNGVVNFGVNNTVDAALASILQQALASPGVLPSSIGSILRPTTPGAIGTEYLTTSASLGHGAGNA